MPHIPLGLLGDLLPERIVASLVWEGENSDPTPSMGPVPLQIGQCWLFSVWSVIPERGVGIITHFCYLVASCPQVTT